MGDRLSSFTTSSGFASTDYLIGYTSASSGGERKVLLQNLYAATPLVATQGGTGITSFAIGDLLYASTTSALSKLAAVATGRVLISNGVNTAPSWSATPTFTVTNLTGTASININGTVGATTPATGKFTTIQGTSYGAGNAVFDSTGLVSSSAGSIGMRNRIVNGDMRIDQFSSGTGVTINSSGPGTFGFQTGADKWKGIGTTAAGAFLMQQASATPPNGYTNYIRATVSTADASPAAGSQYGICSSIEGTYCQDLQFGLVTTQSVTVSFWVRSSLTGAFSGALRNATPNRSYPFSYTINAANTWEYKTVTMQVDQTGTWLTTTGIGVNLVFDLGSGSTGRGTANAWNGNNNLGVTGAASLIGTNGATLDLTGVQLEPGTVATAFEQRPIGDMLRLCQREYAKSFLQATAPAQNVGINTGAPYGIVGLAGATGGSYIIPIRFPVVMRATPSITLYNPAAANAQIRDQTSNVDGSGSGTIGITEVGGCFSATGNAASIVGALISVHYTADARL